MRTTHYGSADLVSNFDTDSQVSSLLATGGEMEMAVFATVYVPNVNAPIVEVTLWDSKNEPIAQKSVASDKLNQVIGNIETHYEFAE